MKLASKLELHNYPFDCKTHRSLLLTRLLFFHTQIAFLCKMCSRQISNSNQIPMPLWPLFCFMKESHLTRQDEKVSHILTAKLVATCLLAKWYLLEDKLRLLCHVKIYCISFVINTFYLFFSLRLALFILINVNCNFDRNR